MRYYRNEYIINTCMFLNVFLFSLKGYPETLTYWKLSSKSTITMHALESFFFFFFWFINTLIWDIQIYLWNVISCTVVTKKSTNLSPWRNCVTRSALSIPNNVGKLTSWGWSGALMWASVELYQVEGQHKAPPWLALRGKIFKLVSNSGQLVPTFLSNWQNQKD